MHVYRPRDEKMLKVNDSLCSYRPGTPLAVILAHLLFRAGICVVHAERFLRSATVSHECHDG